MTDCLLDAMLQVNCFTYTPETSTKGKGQIKCSALPKSYNVFIQ